MRALLNLFNQWSEWEKESIQAWRVFRDFWTRVCSEHVFFLGMYFSGMYFTDNFWTKTFQEIYSAWKHMCVERDQQK